MGDKFQEFKDKYYNIDNGLQQLMFNIITVSGVIGGFISLIYSIALKLPLYQTIAVAAAEIVLILSFYFGNMKGMLCYLRIVPCVVIADILFPIMFFTGGGVNSGMPFWFSIGILFSFFLLNGVALGVVVGSEILVTAACFIVAYHHPEYVTDIGSKRAMFIDMFQSMMIITAVVGIIIKFQVNNYKKMLQKNEENRQALEEATDAKNQFLAKMSHEIRTPINAILGLNEVISQDVEDEKLRDYSHNINDAGKELLAMINKIFEMDGGVDDRECVYFKAPGIKVLVVDDIPLNCKVFKALLESTEIGVTVANRGAEAVNLCAKEHFDIIFMDHMMPGMDGVECLHKIKNGHYDANSMTPVVALTANTGRDMEDFFLKSGFDAYLAKPVTMKALFDTIRKLLPEGSYIIVANSKEVTSEPVVEAPRKESLAEHFYFLDVKAGLTYCMEDEDFYREILKTYIDEPKLEAMDSQLQAQDWDNYRITVHALKSTSLSIGATELSNHAKALEFAARDKDVEYIKNNHEKVCREYGEILDKIAKALVCNAQTAGAEDAAVTEKKATILVVDDDSMNLMMARKMLENRYDLDFAKNGREALSILQEKAFDLVLLDIHMPDMDGHEAFEKIKSQPELADIPVIFLTADDDIETEARGFDEGAMDFIKKPFEQTVALKRIERILELSHLQKNLKSEVEKQTKKAESGRIKLEKLSYQLVKSLGNSIDAKDKYTNGHSTRVAKYSVMIGKRIGYDEERLKQLEYTGLLHDIGKIGIPDSIINKDSKLTDEEYAIIKTHPVVGHSILKEITEIPDISVGARWHHERYDGRGYPDHLKGTEIPEIARVIGVADAYDAMTSNRSYRDVMPQEKVRSEIEKGLGIQFDPEFGKVMLDIIDEDINYELHE